MSQVSRMHPFGPEGFNLTNIAERKSWGKLTSGNGKRGPKKQKKDT